MSKLIDSFANRLSTALLIRNIKAHELSEKTGIDKSKISSYMSGRYKAKQDGVYKLSQVLNVDPAWLMGYDVPMNRNSMIHYGAIYDFSSEKDIKILNTCVIYAIQNKISPDEIFLNNIILESLNDLESLDRTLALNTIKNLSIKYKGKDDFNLDELIISLKYQDDSNVFPISDIPVNVPVLGKISAGIPILAVENIEGYEFAPSSFVKSGYDYFYLRVQGDSMNLKFNEGDIVLVQKQDTLENDEIGVILVNGFDATVKKYKNENGLVILSPMSTNPENVVQIYNPENTEIKIIGKVVCYQGRV